jgi:hypothetical protein
MRMRSEDWAREYAFEPYQTTRRALRDLLAQADRLLADARVAAVSVPSRHALAHSAVVVLARAALASAGYRTLESHHYWAIESLRHTIGLDKSLVAVLHAHRSKRHGAVYGADVAVSEAELDDLLARASELRRRICDALGERDTAPPGGN